MFAPFSTIGYRFSGLIPDKYHKIIEKFVVLEQKYLNIPLLVYLMQFFKIKFSFT